MGLRDFSKLLCMMNVDWLHNNNDDDDDDVTGRVKVGATAESYGCNCLHPA